MADSPNTAILEELKDRREDIEKGNDLLKSPEQQDGETRNDVAKKFVNFYFWIFILLIIATLTYNFIVMATFHDKEILLSLKDTAITYSAIFGPTIGLVIAYYFKQTSRD